MSPIRVVVLRALLTKVPPARGASATSLAISRAAMSASSIFSRQVVFASVGIPPTLLAKRLYVASRLKHTRPLHCLQRINCGS